MKKINLPIIDDEQELNLLLNNPRIRDVDELREQLESFITQYEYYTSEGGNPWAISNLQISENLKSKLHQYYKKPPRNTFSFFKEFRTKLSPNICLMCGSSGNGTLDHYLPKNDYPEFSLFSKNLIPACSCNSRRGTTIKGGKTTERIIHPYFDNVVEERLYQAVFTGDFYAPHISVDVIDHQHPQIDMLRFHLKEVIDSDYILGFFESTWDQLCTTPWNILQYFSESDPANILGSDIRTVIEKIRNLKDGEFQTPNNWFSMFYTGLLIDQERLNDLAECVRNNISAKQDALQASCK